MSCRFASVSACFVVSIAEFDEGAMISLIRGQCAARRKLPPWANLVHSGRRALDDVRASAQPAFCLRNPPTRPTRRSQHRNI
ncbi:hypothetical protein DRB87_09285 [Pandoraea sp. XY-2]|nr:hypothetical protein DRB87_09285 [Pandoraea sp. XY-2]